MSTAPGPIRTSLTTGVALVAFAANSVLCRLALAPGDIDAASFTTVRLGSGALMLWLLVSLEKRAPAGPAGSGNWLSAAALFGYAAAFSFAYRSLSAGTGALILFGFVQLTMLLSAIADGERPPQVEWIGLALAIGGLVWLVLPGLSAPPAVGATLMGLAGVAWGVYSLRGRRSRDVLGDTAGNFARSLPMTGTMSLVLWAWAHVSWAGIGWAALSGAVTSGLGYVVWYAALRGLTAVRAAIVQLSVPVLAGVGGIWLLGEATTWRLVVSAGLILGGIALAVLSRQRARTGS